jgi:hypothetical protein
MLGVSSSSLVHRGRVPAFVEFWHWLGRSWTRMPRGAFAMKRFARHRGTLKDTDVRQKNDNELTRMTPDTKL